MRPLAKITILLQLLGSPAFSMGLVTLEASETELLQLNELSVPTTSKVLSLTSPAILEVAKLNLALTQIHQDLSNRNITLKSKNEIPLSTLDSGIRQTLMTGVEFSTGRHLGVLSTTQDLKKSLFTGKTFSLDQAVQFHSGATQLNLTLLHSEQNQPLSFFIDPGTFESKERLTSIKVNQISIGVEQIWTDIFKTKITSDYKRTENFRPNQYSLKIQQAIAIGQFWTWKSELGSAIENRSEPLKDDRGYFQSVWLDQECSYEWKLDSFIRFGWSTLDENEFDPRRNRETFLGTDEIAASISQSLNLFNYELQISYFLNSEKQTATAYKGNFAWTF